MEKRVPQNVLLLMGGKSFLGVLSAFFGALIALPFVETNGFWSKVSALVSMTGLGFIFGGALTSHFGIVDPSTHGAITGFTSCVCLFILQGAIRLSRKFSRNPFQTLEFFAGLYRKFRGK